MNWNKIFIPALLTVLIMVGLAIFIKVQPRTEVQVKTVKSDPITLPPKIISVTERVPDGEAEDKLIVCREGYKAIILRVNEIKTKHDTEEGLEDDDALFNIDDLAGGYGRCF